MGKSSIPGIVWQTGLWAGCIAVIASFALGFTPVGDDAAPFFRWPGLALLLIAAVFGIIDYDIRRFSREFGESISIAGAQIRANKMRSMLTALGVIIGIVAVTLMGTAIIGIDAGVEDTLSGLGDDVLYVNKWPWKDVNDWWDIRNRREIDTAFAAPVNDYIALQPGSALKLAVPAAGWNATVIHGEYRVNNINIVGTGADYGRIVRSEMKEGRFFTEIEAKSARNVVVIGFDVGDALFPGDTAVGKTVRIRNQQYTVIGVAARQGGWLGAFSWDSKVIMPLDSFARSFPVRWANPEIRVQVDVTRMEEAKDELRGLMRRIRRLSPERKDDFEINSQQVIREQLDPIKKNIAIGGFLITGLSLFVGAIGIMNITYVSVKERTKEIGTRKALGARRRTILLQFLIEAVSICVLGGLGGLIAAWGMAAAAGALMPAFPIIFSTTLILVGIGLSVLTGFLSGFAPAWQASKLDPVVALRYE